jgi:hypothetical protein
MLLVTSDDELLPPTFLPVHPTYRWRERQEWGVTRKWLIQHSAI